MRPALVKLAWIWSFGSALLHLRRLYVGVALLEVVGVDRGRDTMLRLRRRYVWSVSLRMKLGRTRRWS